MLKVSVRSVLQRRMCIASLTAIAPKYRDYICVGNCLACWGVLCLISTRPFIPSPLTVPFDPCSPPWQSMTFFANSLHSSFLRTDMLCGSRAHGNRIGLWKSAMSVSYAVADFIIFSMLCVPQKDNPTCQSIMNNFRPSFRIISARVFFVLTITVLPESAWSLNQNITPPGNCDLLSRLFIADIVTVQMTSSFRKFCSGVQAGEEVQ